MNSVILSFCSLGIVFSIVTSVIDISKFEKELRLMFITIVLITIVKSLFSLDLSVLKDVSLDTNPYTVEEISTEDCITQQITSNLEDSIKLLLEDNGLICENISVSINITEDNCISINKVVLSTNDFEQAKTLILKNFGNVTIINIDY